MFQRSSVRHDTTQPGRQGQGLHCGQCGQDCLPLGLHADSDLPRLPEGGGPGHARADLCQSAMGLIL